MFGLGRQLVGPLPHERPAALEWVVAPAGDLGGIAVDVGQSELADLVRRVGALGCPVAG